MLLKDINEMAMQDVDAAEREVDEMFRAIGLDVIFTQHFKNRIADNTPESRDTDVTEREIASAFSALKQQYGKQLLKAKFDKAQFQGLLKDISTKLNIPFAIDYDRVYSGLHKLYAKTIMRKDNFTPSSPYEKILPVKSKEIHK